MTRKEAKSCIGTIEMLQRLAYNIHGVMDVIDADNCEKIIKALEQEPVLDKIRSEIEQDAFKDVNGSKYIFVNRVNQILDKCKAESEKTI